MEYTAYRIKSAPALNILSLTQMHTNTLTHILQQSIHLVYITTENVRTNAIHNCIYVLCNILCIEYIHSFHHRIFFNVPIVKSFNEFVCIFICSTLLFVLFSYEPRNRKQKLFLYSGKNDVV